MDLGGQFRGEKGHFQQGEPGQMVGLHPESLFVGRIAAQVAVVRPLEKEGNGHRVGEGALEGQLFAQGLFSLDQAFFRAPVPFQHPFHFLGALRHPLFQILGGVPENFPHPVMGQENTVDFLPGGDRVRGRAEIQMADPVRPRRQVFQGAAHLTAEPGGEENTGHQGD